MSTSVFAAGCTISNNFIMVAPSFETVVFPRSSRTSLSSPLGPNVVRTASATAQHALMLDTHCPRPCDESVPCEGAQFAVAARARHRSNASRDDTIRADARRSSRLASRVAVPRARRAHRQSRVESMDDARDEDQTTHKKQFLPPRATPHPRPARLSRGGSRSSQRIGRARRPRGSRRRHRPRARRVDVRATRRWRDKIEKIRTINRPSGMRTMGVDIASSAEGRCDDRLDPWASRRGLRTDEEWVHSEGLVTSHEW